MQDVTELKKRLDAFCKAVRSDIRRGLQSKEYFSEQKLQTKFGPDTDFQIVEGFIKVPSATFCQVGEEDWNSTWARINKKFDKYGQELELPHQLVGHIIASCLPNSNQSTRKVCQEYLKIIKDQRAPVYCRAALFGIAPRDKSASFSFMGSRFKLRRFTKAEYEALYGASHLYHFHHQFPSSWLEIHYSNVKTQPLSMRPEDNYFRPASHDLEVFVMFLKLYRTCSPSIAWSNTYVGSNAAHFLHGQCPMPSSTIYKASISQQEFRQATRVFEQHFSALSDYSVYSIDKGLPHIKVALEMYNDALKKGQKHKRVAYIVMGLEALFTGKEPQLKRSLSMRVGWLVHGLTSEDCTRLINKAYDLRSAYAHGDPGVKKQLAKFNFHGSVDDTIQRLMNIFRLCLLVAIKNSNRPLSFVREEIDEIMTLSQSKSREYSIPKICIG